MRDEEASSQNPITSHLAFIGLWGHGLVGSLRGMEGCVGVRGLGDGDEWESCSLLRDWWRDDDSMSGVRWGGCMYDGDCGCDSDPEKKQIERFRTEGNARSEIAVV